MPASVARGIICHMPGAVGKLSMVKKITKKFEWQDCHDFQQGNAFAAICIHYEYIHNECAQVNPEFSFLSYT